MVKIVAFNKPFDVHSQFRGEDGQLTLTQFIHDKDLRIAGRLDRDSEGLMLLTDDGRLNQQITHPKFKQYKTYIAQVDGQVSQQAIVQLQQGVKLNDGITLPAKVQQIDEPTWLWPRNPPIRYRANIPTSWLEIQICEGRNRQVRRMTAAVGFPTLRLIRIQIGSVNLLDLDLACGESQNLEPLFYAEFQHMYDRTKSNVKKDKPFTKNCKLNTKKSKNVPHSHFDKGKKRQKF